MTKLATRIERIGREMVQCNEGCEGVGCNQKKGILPRCLYLQDRPGKKGSVVVGLNPGRSRKKERDYYCENCGTYAVVRDGLADQIKYVRYYMNMTKFLAALGREGPILWTELAKCENEKGFRGLLPLQTFRTCTSKYLHRELEPVSRDWPIFGAGREAFKALAYKFPDRIVIGVPHPNSHGQFARLFAHHRLYRKLKQEVDLALEARKAVWLEGP